MHEQHEKYGAFVRISPNHVSIGDPKFIKVARRRLIGFHSANRCQDVMGHGNGFSKSGFYEIFDWNSQSIFTTRSREVHSRKRKWLAATFSARSIKDFERFITDALVLYGRQMENLIDDERAGKYKYPITDEIATRKTMSEGIVDAVTWNAFLAFDVIGDLVSSHASCNL